MSKQGVVEIGLHGPSRKARHASSLFLENSGKEVSMFPQVALRLAGLQVNYFMQENMLSESSFHLLYRVLFSFSPEDSCSTFV